MLPSFHIAMTFLLWFLLTKLGFNAPFLLLIMLIAGVLIDLDILFVHPHRLAITHTPFFWIVITTIALFFSISYSLGIFIASMTHLLVDLIDGEVRLFFPFSRKMYGLNIIVKRYKLDPYKNSPIEFTKMIFKTPEIVVPEILVDSIALYVFGAVYNFNLLSIMT